MILIQWSCPRDESDLFNLPWVTLYRFRESSVQRMVLVFCHSHRPLKILVRRIRHTLEFQYSELSLFRVRGLFEDYTVWSFQPKTIFYYSFPGYFNHYLRDVHDDITLYRVRQDPVNQDWDLSFGQDAHGRTFPSFLKSLQFFKGFSKSCDIFTTKMCLRAFFRLPHASGSTFF